VAKVLFIILFSLVKHLRIQLLNHILRIGKFNWVPGEVFLSVGMLNVEPDCVEGDVVFVEGFVHGLHIGLVIIVPSALMVGYGELLQRGRGE
jgi:hypothetical protein